MVISRLSSVMIMHIVGLIFMPHLMHAFSNSLVDISNFCQRQDFLRFFMTNSRNRLKRIGDSGASLSHTSYCVEPISDFSIDITTAHFVCLFKFSMRSTNTWSTPMERRHFQSASLQMVSNTALKSNFQWSFIRFSPSLLNDLANDKHSIRITRRATESTLFFSQVVVNGYLYSIENHPAENFIRNRE